MRYDELNKPKAVHSKAIFSIIFAWTKNLLKYIQRLSDCSVPCNSNDGGRGLATESDVKRLSQWTNIESQYPITSSWKKKISNIFFLTRE